MKFPHNSSRVEAFSDGVFAFAATLMAVSIDMDESMVSLASNGSGFITFGVSFFVLAALWWLHYNYFRRTRYMDNAIIALNCILLFVILYYVFPLKSLVNSLLGNEVTSLEALASLFQLYSLGFVLIFLCLALMYFRAYKKTKDTEQGLVLYFYARHFAIYVLVAFGSILLAKFRVGLEFALPGIIYAILGPLCYLHGVHFDKKYKTAIE